jgi:transglutaminase-like putative cysteine protease
MNPAGANATDASALARPVLFARVAADSQAEHSLHVEVRYHATLIARRLMALPPGARPLPVQRLTAAERQVYLAATPSVDFQAPAFQQWLTDSGLRRRPGERDLDFAYRLFQAMRQSFQYGLNPNDFKASAICVQRRGTCGGLSLVYVAALRANGVPARMLWGRWAQSSKPGATVLGMPFSQQHVKAEFYAAEAGWVPADMSSAILNDRTPAGLQYFGIDRGDFVTLHVDTDLVLDSVHWGPQTVTDLRQPAFWAAGTGTLDGQTTTVSWQVRPTR